MRHLIVCSEYPPAPIPPGGIGTYVEHISRLLAEAGEQVHVLSILWHGAPKPLEERCAGNLVIHRVSVDEPVPGGKFSTDSAVRTTLFRSAFPRQLFAWQATQLAEQLVEQERIDVIETQEYDAPLYYFQLRRALGLGPSWKPPIIVHLHSPTEFIVRHNEYDSGRPDFVTATQMESFSITSADGLVCPSRYLARQAADRYGLEEPVNVIPLPIGDSPELSRDQEVWSSGPICYVGRLEPRKGVIEWVDAAVSAALVDPNVVFDFIG